jgi:transcriptional regulator ATRX
LQTCIHELFWADDKSKWKCFVCDPKPLETLIKQCDQLISQVEKVTNEKDKMRMQALKQAKPASPTKPASMKRSPAAGKQTARKSTTLNMAQASSRPTPAARQIPNQKAQKGKQSGFGLAEQIAKQAVQRMTDLRGRMPFSAPRPMTTMTARPSTPGVRMPQQLSQSRPLAKDIPINEFNVTPVLDRMFVAVQSMHMLVNSLKDELKDAARKAQDINQLQAAKQLVALKLKRAFVAYQKSFMDIESYAKNFQPIQKPAHATMRVGGGTVRTAATGKATADFLAKHGAKMKPNEVRMVATNTGLKHLVPPPKPQKPSEVIELSDSDDDMEQGENGKGSSSKSKKRKISSEDQPDEKKSKEETVEEAKVNIKDAEEEKITEGDEKEKEEKKDEKEESAEPEIEAGKEDVLECSAEQEEKDENHETDMEKEATMDEEVPPPLEVTTTDVELNNSSDLNGNEGDGLSEGDDELNPKLVGFKALGPMEFDSTEISQVDGMDDPKEDVPDEMKDELRAFEENLMKTFSFEPNDYAQGSGSESDDNLAFEKVEAAYKKGKTSKPDRKSVEASDPMPSTSSSSELPVAGRSREDIECQRKMLKKSLEIDGSDDDDSSDGRNYVILNS